MFQPDEPNGLRNIMILWFVLFLVLLAVTSCETIPAPLPNEEDRCPSTEIVGSDLSSDEVLEHMLYALKGCEKYYGKGACLVRLVRVSPRNYHAVCRRK